MMMRLKSRTDKMASTTRFFVSICVNNQYKNDIKPVLDRQADRHERYAAMFAEQLGCNVEVIALYLYMCIMTVTGYVI